MKRKILFIAVTSLMTCLNINAQTVSEGDARAKALEFFSNGAKKLPAKNGAKRQAPAVGNVELAYTSQKEGKTCFYVFNNGTDGGFVIVGGDEAAKEILAYVPQGHFNYDKAPDNLKWWLSQYEQEISFAQNTEVQTSQVSAPQRIVQTKETTSYREQFTDIPDMITTKWGQGEYFNNAIPLIGDEHPVTGCVATALAQIMKYWNYPSEGKGSIENGEYSVNFAEATYDWDNMLDDYYLGEPTQTQIDAVSQLMYHIGASLGYSYHFGIGSTEYINIIGSQHKTILQNSLEDHFGYSTNNTHLLRDGVCDEDWECIIYSELSAGRPIFYAGSYENGIGHAFVCHGYSSALGMFAFNWGWNGSEDGYYALSSTDGVNGFTSKQWILTGFEPEGRQHRNQIEYGDRFTADGYNYSVHNPILKRAALAPVLSGEYSGDVEVSGSVFYQGTNFDVTHIDQFAFLNIAEYYNFSIRSISLPNSILSLGASALKGVYYVHELKLPANLKKIGTECFSSCGDLDSITIPEGVTVINENCFNGCHSLKSIYLHDNITYLGYGCFSNCESLKELTIPNGIKYLDQIIYGPNSLLKITLPSTIESLHYTCFYHCSKLSYLYCNSIEVPQVLSETFPENIKTGVLFVPQCAIEAYSNAEFWKNWGTIEAIETAKETNYLGESFEVDGIRYSVIANGVVVEKCITRQQEIVIPQRVEYKGELFDVLQIGTYAFLNYDENDVLETVVLPEGLKVIANSAFSNCFHLKNINLPESIIEIGEVAFADCM